MTFKLTPEQEFEVVKLKGAMKKASREQLEDIVIQLYRMDKQRTNFFIEQIKQLTEAVLKSKDVIR